MSDQKTKAAPDAKTGAALKTTSNQYVKPLPLYRQPLRGLVAYERLRDEWVSEHPDHTGTELLQACVTFARTCGLILRELVLQEHLRREGHDPA